MFEKKRGTRFLASVMALVMLLSLAPVGALAVEDEEQNQEVVALPANQADPKPVVTDEENTANTNEEPTPPPRNEGVTGLPTNNNNAPVVVEGESPVKESMITHLSSSNGTVMYDYNSGTVNLRVGENSHCTVYYVENDSADLTEFTSNVYHTYRSPYGIVFFVKPDDGYALTNIKADNTQSEFYSIVDNTNIKETEFYTKNSSTGKRIPSVEKLIQGGFTPSNIDSLVQKAKEAGCVAGFIFTRDTNTRGNISSTLSFYAEKLATLKKEVDSVKRNNVPIDLATTKVREGDVIEYSFTVTYYQGEKPITYKSVQVTDSRVTNPQTMTFNGPSSKVTKETKKATYTVTKQDITDAAKIDDKLINTATLTYTYQAPYNNGEYTVSDTATANVTTVGTVSYEYKGTVPDGVANLPATASHEKNEQVRVADRPNDITGYTFKGWTAPADVTVNSDGYFAMPDKSITFTGEWIANKYSVTYKDEAKILSDLSQNEVAYGTNVAVPSYSKDGYTLTGWKSDADNNTYSPNQTFTMPDKDVTLTAQWKETNPAPDPDPDPTPGPSTLVPAKFFINLGGKDASNREGIGEFTGDITINNALNYTLFEQKKSKDMTSNNGYIFEKNGVKTVEGCGDNNLLRAEPREDQINSALSAVNRPDLSVGGEGNRYVVWYHVSDCGDDGYHVDGYIKNAAIKITYNPNSGNFGTTVQVDESGNYKVDGVSGTTYNIIQETPTREGYNFTGWKLDNKGTLYKSGDSITPTGDVTLVAQWEKNQEPSPDTVNYTINQHFMNGKGEKDSALDKPGTAQSGEEGTALSVLIKDLTKGRTIGNDNYMYVSGKYTTKSESKKDQPITSESKLTEDTTIDLYYYLDNWKDGSSVKEDNEKGGDRIPDCDQVLIKYVSSNSDRGTVSPDMEVLTIRKGNEKVEATANGSTATDNGGRNYFSNWTKDNTQVSTNATLNNETIQKVIKKFTGGETYTFIANFGRSSGGSSRPSTPTVTIPDDVPTGLNGKDHYAYIIGYGNNDVRPQNNITRAEVATIFFRLLTDETRTANMTKSNSYNDVKNGDWFCCAVSTLSKMGIIKGYEDGSFKPNDPISRAEFAAIAARFDPDGDKTPASFADVTSHWAKDEISIAANHGWIKGYEDGSFKPDQKITRAETMTLVNRVLNRLPETKDDLHKDMKTWVDNMDETAWYYLAVQEATNSHYFKNKTSTKFEQWTDLRDTRDWSELEK